MNWGFPFQQVSVCIAGHQKMPLAGWASSGIEFCDVLSDEGELIHVKKKSRSAALSHLFAEGAASASTFLSNWSVQR